MFSLFMLVVGMIVGVAFCFIYFAAVKDHYLLAERYEKALKASRSWMGHASDNRKLLDQWVTWGVNLEKESKEAREFWQWNRKANRGVITQFRLMQRAKKRLGIK